MKSRKRIMVWALRLSLSAALLILVQWIVYKFFAFKGVKYERILSRSAIFEGEEVELVERIENRKLLPMGWVSAEIGMGENIEVLPRPGVYVRYKEYSRSVFSIMPYSSVTRRNRIVCRKRGEYYFNSVFLTTADLLGFSGDIAKQFDINASLLVYPRPAELRKLALPCHGWMGDLIMRRYILEDPFFTSGTRPYREGDPLNRISWKATARTNEIQSYSYDFTAESKLFIWLNVETDVSQKGTPDNEGKKLIDFGVAACAYFAEKAIENGINASFCSNAYLLNNAENQILKPKTGIHQLYAILGELARIDYMYRSPFYRFLKEQVSLNLSGYDILIVTPYTDKTAENHIEELRRLGNNVEVMVFGKDVLS